MALQKQEQKITTRLDKYFEDTKRRSYFVAAATTIFVLIIFLFGVRPAVSSVLKQNKANKVRDEAIDALELKLNTLRSLVQESEQDKDLISYFNQLFPENSSDQDYVLGELVDLVQGSNLKIVSLNFVEESNFSTVQIDFGAAPQVKSLAVSVSIDGQYGDIINFLKEMETSRRVYHLNTISITKKIQQDGQDSILDLPLRLSLEMDLFYWEDEIPTV